jgi:hypothetical protein
LWISASGLSYCRAASKNSWVMVPGAGRGPPRAVATAGAAAAGEAAGVVRWSCTSIAASGMRLGRGGRGGAAHEPVGDPPETAKVGTGPAEDHAARCRHGRATHALLVR